MKQDNRLRVQLKNGFTIIEVLFVLAIAGLILLLVFQAIPTLQRSSRNNQRKQDISTILRAVSQYELKDSGNFPLPCNTTTPPTPPCNQDHSDTIAYPNDYFLRFVKDKLTFYTEPDQVVLVPQTAPAAPDPDIVKTDDRDKVFVYNYLKCDSPARGAPYIQGRALPKGAGFNDVVAIYALEGGDNSIVSQCQQL